MEISSTLAKGLSELRERNRLRVLEALRCGSPLSQTTISRMTGLSRSTVWTVVRELRQDGLICEHRLTESVGRGGRPATRLSLNRASIAVGREVNAADINHLPAINLIQIDQLLASALLLTQENTRLKSLLTSIAELADEAAAPMKGLARRNRRND